MKDILDRDFADFIWAKVKREWISEKAWAGTPKNPKGWPPDTRARASKLPYHTGTGFFYSLSIATDTDKIMAYGDNEDLSKLRSVVFTYMGRYQALRRHRDRLADQDPPPKGARVFERREVQSGAVLVPAPGKELFIWDVRGDRRVVSYRHGTDTGHLIEGLPGEPAPVQRVVVDRVNTRGIYVAVPGEKKPLRIASLAHHGTPISDGWLLVPPKKDLP